MKAEHRKAELKKEESVVLDEKKANEQIEEAKEAQLNELKVKADIKTKGTDNAAESKAKAQLRKAYVEDSQNKQRQERKVKFTGKTMVKNNSADAQIGPEARLEQQREKEVAEAKEKSAESGQMGTDERRSKKDIRKSMANKEERMEVKVGVQELQKTENEQKQEVAKEEEQAEKA